GRRSRGASWPAKGLGGGAVEPLGTRVRVPYGPGAGRGAPSQVRAGCRWLDLTAAGESPQSSAATSPRTELVAAHSVVVSHCSSPVVAGAAAARDRARLQSVVPRGGGVAAVGPLRPRAGATPVGGRGRPAAAPWTRRPASAS